MKPKEGDAENPLKSRQKKLKKKEMQKKLIKLTLGISIILGTMSFIACSDENEIVNNPKKSTEVSDINFNRRHIDSVAAEITTFHAEAMTQFLYTMYHDGDMLTDSYKHDLYSFFLKKIRTHNFITFDTTGIYSDLTPEAETFAILDMSISDVINIYDTINFFNVSIINSVIETIDDSMSFIFDTLTDFNYFSDYYADMVDRQLSVLPNKEYLPLRMYATMSLGSMYTWYSYYDGAFNFKSSKKKPNHEAWEQAKAIIKEDAKEACKGAIIGAIKGFIKTLPTGNPSVIAAGVVSEAAKEGITDGVVGSAKEFIKQQSQKNNKTE